MSIVNLLHTLLFLASVALAARVEVNWEVGHVIVNRDGHITRRAVGVNGHLPIPPVYATVGDTLLLKVCNKLDVPTTVHAHGIFQNGTNYLDGAGMVTQCGIPPGANFTYEYYLHQTGTFWLHGHYNHQNTDGLRTPLVILDRDKTQLPMQYDDEMLISMEDWYPTEFLERMKEVLNPNVPFPPPTTFPYGLINGIDGNITQTITFEPGKRYRIRLINIGSTEWYKFSIPGHKLNVIEADGIYSEPLEVDGLNLGPGQRYSVVVQALDTDEYNYIFNATLYANFVPHIPGLNPRYYTGLVQYKKGASIKSIERSSDEELVWLNDINLRSFEQYPAMPVSRTYNTAAGSKKYSDKLTRAILYKEPYLSPPIIPTLYTAISTGDLALNDTIYGPQTGALVIREGEVIEIEMQNPTEIDHAMHLHGHVFQVTEYGPAGNSSEVNAPPAKVMTYDGWPMRRDTFVVPAFHYIKVRFLADNPGVWMFHCHMDIHFALGLAVTFVEAPDVLQKTQTIPDAMKDMCLRQGLKVMGNGAGNNGFDLAGLPPVPT
ncbi:ferroxidase fet3 [Coemansia sp. RSA 2607]|nr:ferroxidase fet3 [Coemansia sp. RSA 2607]KAJ2397607.1 ferroxidase fet3 [Coemansia sp. RSA 2603]